MSQSTIPTAEQAINFIVQTLRKEGPAGHGLFGYHMTVIDMTVRWRRAHEGEIKGNAVESRRTYEVSSPFYDAAWELARRGILRPSVRNSLPQWSAFNYAGGGYSLTAAGYAWLQQQGDRPLGLMERWGPFTDL
jgi:hypothetical protein